MVVAFLAKYDFQNTDQDGVCMLTTVFSAAMGEPAIFYLIKRFGCFKNYISYHFERCKQYLIEELDVLSREFLHLSKDHLTHETVSAFCEYYMKYVSKKDSK